MCSPLHCGAALLYGIRGQKETERTDWDEGYTQHYMKQAEETLEHAVLLQHIRHMHHKYCTVHAAG